MASESVDIRPLSSDLLPDFLEYFEGSAFADNPGWRSCYCQFLYVDHSRIHWAERTAEQNRRAACERICSSRMQGHLAYRKGQVVGWCNAAPRAMMDAFADEPDPDATGDAENHYGPLGLFVGAGFAFHRQGEHGSICVRKSLR